MGTFFPMIDDVWDFPTIFFTSAAIILGNFSCESVWVLRGLFHVWIMRNVDDDEAGFL